MHPRKSPFVSHAPAAAAILFLAAALLCLADRFDAAVREAGEANMHLTRTELGEANRRQYLAAVNEAVSALNAEPGLAVARVRPVKGGSFEITVLKDPVARDPESVMGRLRLPGNRDKYRLAVKPYVSAEPSLVLFRAERLLGLPPGVRAAYRPEDGVLELSGPAPLGRIQEILKLAPFVPGVLQVKAADLSDPLEGRAVELLEQADGLSLHFAPGEAEPTDPVLLASAARSLGDLARLAPGMDVPVNVFVYGSPDRRPGAPKPSEAREAEDEALALSRAEMVARALAASGAVAAFRAFGSDAAFRAFGSDGSLHSGPGPGPAGLKASGVAVVRVSLGDGRGLHTPRSGCPYPGPWGAPECPDAPAPEPEKGRH
jgi:hypothetical protein